MVSLSGTPSSNNPHAHSSHGFRGGGGYQSRVDTTTQGMNASNAGTNQRVDQVVIPQASTTSVPEGCNLIYQSTTGPPKATHMMNMYCTNNPAMLQGSRRYIDASTPPDHLSPQPRTTSLGIFIINF
jgi:hypothetical protein